MVQPAKIEVKIRAYRQKLEVLDQARSEEMKKHFEKRSRRLLDFLHKEQSVYSFALSELQNLLEDGHAQ